MSQDHHRNNSLPPPAPTGARTTDPVCGMTVDRTQAAGTHRHAGTTYAFCSRDYLDHVVPRLCPDHRVAGPCREKPPTPRRMDRADSTLWRHRIILTSIRIRTRDFAGAPPSNERKTSPQRRARLPLYRCFFYGGGDDTRSKDVPIAILAASWITWF
jgi:YHS domain-containing protein